MVSVFIASMAASIIFLSAGTRQGLPVEMLHRSFVLPWFVGVMFVAC